MKNKNSVGDILNHLVELAIFKKKVSFKKMALTAGLDPGVDFRGASLRELDFRDEDLTGFDFSGADLTGSDFRRAKISKVRFDNATLNGVVGVNLDDESQKELELSKAAATQMVKKSIIAGIVPDPLLAQRVSQLRFGKTGISDISLVSHVKYLENISLIGTNIENIEAIASLNYLKSINIDETRVKDLSPLSACPTIELISANSAPIGILSGIRSCDNISTLLLNNTFISHIEEVVCFERLSRLSIGGINLSDISTIQRCNFIQSLSVSSPILSDLPDFRHLEYLRTLKISSISKSFPEIDGLSLLTNLYFTSKNCQYIPDLSSLKNLKFLTLDMNKDFNFDKLHMGDAIRNLTLHNIDINNLKDIKGADNIKNLTLFYSRLNDFSSLHKLPNIERLSIFQVGNYIDLSSLPACEKLEYISLKGELYTGLESLGRLKNLKVISTDSIDHVKYIQQSGIKVQVFLDGIGPAVYVDSDGGGYIKFIEMKGLNRLNNAISR